MLIQLNTDHNIESSPELTLEVETALLADVGHHSEQITRIEVYLKDNNGPKKGPEDKRCQIEARIAGLRPVSVSHEDATVSQAINGASTKLKTILDRTFEELNQRPRRSAAHDDHRNSSPDDLAAANSSED